MGPVAEDEVELDAGGVAEGQPPVDLDLMAGVGPQCGARSQFVAELADRRTADAGGSVTR